mmetsp:Transcript_5270/g.10793  ORF Transcript_5270/g.10793 Transcript_5270/m.10793 type:complete len:137 (-) Transcript_5270:2934-3344(-)
MKVCGSDDVGMVFFHPEYDRTSMAGLLPVMAPASGHLPSEPFMKSYLIREWTSIHGEQRADERDATIGRQVHAANFARKSPVPMINILRGKHVRAAEEKSLKQRIYTRNAIRLEEAGVETLSAILRGIRENPSGRE